MRNSTSALLVTLACIIAGPSAASDFYATGNIGLSGVTGDSGGGNIFFDNFGSDSDSSPVYGGALGITVPINDLLPTRWDDRLRSWRVNLPTWDLRFELEGVAGRDYELRTQGGDGFFTELDNWTVMHNLWMDVPLRDPINWAFGRFPLLEPVSLYLGAGIGVGGTKISATDNISSGSETNFEFAWQAGAGLAYELTEYVTISAGYRYFDFNVNEIELFGAGPDVFGTYSLDATAHEFNAGIRVNFYTVAWPDWD